MAKKRTVLLSIEGLDGAGKSLQSQLLYDNLTSLGSQVSVIDFPQYDSFFGKEIGAYLSARNSIDAINLDIKSMSLWYAVDRWKKLSQIDMCQYDYVIFNRYTLSNVAYQASRVPEPSQMEYIDWLLELEHKQLHLPIPDMYIFLNLPPEMSIELNNQKESRKYLNGHIDVYENSIVTQISVRNIYLNLVETMNNIKIINCVENGRLLSPVEISKNIFSELICYLDIEHP